MSEQKVAFDQNGDYHLTGGIQNMDVHRHVEEDSTAPKKSTGKKSAAASATKSSSGGFDLGKLRRQAGMAAGTSKSTSTRTPGKKKKEKPEVTPAEQKEATPPTPPTPPQPVAEEPKLPVESVVKEPAPTTETVEPVEKEIKKDSAEPKPTKIPRPGASLSELGMEGAKVESVLEDAPTGGFDLSSLGRSQTNSKPNSTTPKEKSAVELKVTSDEKAAVPSSMDLEKPTAPITPPPSVPEEKPPKYAPHFDIVPAAELLAHPFGASAIEDTPRYLLDWILRALKAYVSHPSAIFTTKDVPGLRIYASISANTKDSKICVGIGNGVKFTAVGYDSSRDCLRDLSHLLTNSGMCVMLGDHPLAITSLIDATRTISV